jgi:F420-dependent oxidoreductase-like protein
MRLALNLRYLGPLGTASHPKDFAIYAQEAERLGFSVVWIAEAFSSDAPSLLGWIAAHTKRIELGAGAMQIPARSPAMTAMTAATLDTICTGRFRLGLGISGPQVSEGWHGVRFGRPLERTREYVDIVRLALRKQRVGGLEYAGRHYALPLPDGPGKALRLAMRPVRREVPIYLAAVGPKNLELAGEIAQGWLAVFFDPEFGADHLTHVRIGRQRAGQNLSGFDVVAKVPLVVGDDVAACAEPVRHYTAHFIGGAGPREENFYYRLAVRMGYGPGAREVQDRYLAGSIAGAAAAVPAELVDATALLGPANRIADRLQAYAEAGVTTLSVLLFPRDVADGVRTLRAVADALDKSGVVE